MGIRSRLLITLLLALYYCNGVRSFVVSPTFPRRAGSDQRRCSLSRDGMYQYRRFCGSGVHRQREGRREVAVMMARGSAFRSRGESKRQARVSQLVTTELAKIFRLGHGIKTKDKIADDVRCKIGVVDVDMSPDLRTAKVFISVLGDVLEKREAYAWCVKNTKAIRMALAVELKGMKRIPDLYFRDMDIGAAVDLMALIDKVSEEDEDVAAAAARGDSIDYDQGIDGSEGLTEDDFFTFDFDGFEEEDRDEDEDAGFTGFELSDTEMDGNLE